MARLPTPERSLLALRSVRLDCYCTALRIGGNLELRNVGIVFVRVRVSSTLSPYHIAAVVPAIIPYVCCEDVRCFQLSLMASTATLGCFFSDARFNPFHHEMSTQRTLARPLPPLGIGLDMLQIFNFSAFRDHRQQQEVYFSYFVSR